MEKINEGVYDKYILKAVFIVGGPGSGKSYISDKILRWSGLKFVDSDVGFMHFLRKDLEIGSSVDLSKIGDYSKSRKAGTDLTKYIEQIYTSGRLGVVIQDTGYNLEKVEAHVNILRNLGYDCYCVIVNTDLQTARNRNASRARIIPDDVVIKKWESVQHNLGGFQNLFGMDKLILFDNTTPSSEKIEKLTKDIRKIISSPVDNYIGNEWIKTALKQKPRI